MKTIQRTRLLGLLLSAGLTALAGTPAFAAYPDKPLRLVVSMPAGGGADSVARLIAAKVSEKLGQPVVIDNKAGADGSIGADMVARAPADGYTLAWITNSHVVAPLQIKVPYNAATSFAPIIQVSQAPDVLLVRPGFPASTMAGLVAQAKAKPGELVFGSAGVSTPSSLETTLLMNLTGIQMLAVPYKGGSEVMVGLLGESVDMYFATLSTALPYVANGKLKPLAVSSRTRTPLLPNVPTVAEALNLPGFEGGNWLGVLAPAGTPKDIVDKLNKAFADSINSPDIKERLAAMGWTPIAGTPDAFGAVIRSDLKRWAETLKATERK